MQFVGFEPPIWTSEKSLPMNQSRVQFASLRKLNRVWSSFALDFEKWFLSANVFSPRSCLFSRRKDFKNLNREMSREIHRTGRKRWPNWIAIVSHVPRCSVVIILYLRDHLHTNTCSCSVEFDSTIAFTARNLFKRFLLLLYLTDINWHTFGTEQGYRISTWSLIEL